eukprot:2156242-Alexandrium_andersonii.AAC.1
MKGKLADGPALRADSYDGCTYTIAVNATALNGTSSRGAALQESSNAQLQWEVFSITIRIIGLLCAGLRCVLAWPRTWEPRSSLLYSELFQAFGPAEFFGRDSTGCRLALCGHQEGCWRGAARRAEGRRPGLRS